MCYFFLQTDLMGQTLFNITSPDDHERLKFFLQYEGALDAEYKKNFNLKLKRAGPRSETAVYEPVRLMGMHRLATNPSYSQSPTSSTTVAIKNDVSINQYFRIVGLSEHPLNFMK